MNDGLSGVYADEDCAKRQEGGKFTMLLKRFEMQVIALERQSFDITDKLDRLDYFKADIKLNNPGDDVIIPEAKTIVDKFVFQLNVLEKIINKFERNIQKFNEIL